MQTKKLKDLVEFLDNRRKPLNNLEREKMKGNIPYYGTNGVVDYVNEYLFDEPLILLAEDGGHFGSKTKPIAYKIEGKAWVNNHAHVLKPKTGYNIDFLKWSLSFYDVTKYTTGSTRVKLTKGDAERMEFRIPDLKTQQEIAHVLEQADKARQKRKAANTLTDEFLQSSFLSLFGDLVVNNKKFPVKRLDEIADVSSGVTKGRNLNGAEVISVPYMRVANVQDGHLNLSEIKEIEIREYELEKFLLHEGDILLTEGGDPDKLGRGAVWYNQIEKCIHQNHIFKVRPDKKKFASEFLSYQFASPYGKRYFFKAAKQTTGIASINSTQLKAFPVIVPPLSLQQQFAGIVAQAEQLRQKQKESEQELENFFQGLLQKYFG